MNPNIWPPCLHSAGEDGQQIPTCTSSWSNKSANTTWAHGQLISGMHLFMAGRWERNLAEVLHPILVSLKSLPLCDSWKSVLITYGVHEERGVMSDDGATVLHMAPDLVKVRPTVNPRSLLTLEVSGVPSALVRGDHMETLSLHSPSFVLILLLPVTNFSRNYFSFVQVSFF